MSTPNKYLLSIESAVAGGSIALFENELLFASRCGDGSVSRAEDLLPNVISMLGEAEISKGDISRVAVSLGPGSYTGLRIGIAAVMGLKRGLGIEYVGVPLFEALAAGVEEAVIAVPMGKAEVCFTKPGDVGSPKVVSIDEFAGFLLSVSSGRVRIHDALREPLNDVIGFGIETFGPNLAEFIGRAAMLRPPSRSLEPIYVQNPRFG